MLHLRSQLAVAELLLNVIAGLAGADRLPGQAKLRGDENVGDDDNAEQGEMQIQFGEEGSALHGFAPPV